MGKRARVTIVEDDGATLPPVLAHFPATPSSAAQVDAARFALLENGRKQRRLTAASETAMYTVRAPRKSARSRGATMGAVSRRFDATGGKRVC